MIEEILPVSIIAPLTVPSNANQHPPYPAYKSSGVDWLVDIPEHWEAKKIKRLCLVKRGASPRPIDDPIYFDEAGEYSWVRISDVTASNKYLLTSEQKLSELGKSKSVPLEPGDIFLSIAATVGKPIITKIKCCIHDGFVYFIGLRENNDYLYYVFSSGELYKGLGKLGTQLNLNTDTIGDIIIPVPPFLEQQAIAAYLDRETAKIDKLVAQKEKLIALLQEKRAALISQAITRGLDPSVPLKDSGVEWLGEIPAHWEAKRLKHIAPISKLKLTEKPLDTVYVGLENIESKTGKLLLDNPVEIVESTVGVFQQGSILFGKLRPYLAKVVYAPFEGVCTTELLVLRPNEFTMNKFLYYQLISEGFINLINSMTFGTKMPRASSEQVENQYVPVPPLAEQKQTTKILDEETAKIDQLVDTVKEGIERLKEYRTALISAAVTGKIDVRGQG